MAAFSSESNPNRVLSVFSLVMINVIAVDSLRTLPFSAKFGTTLLFWYLLAAIVFFVPVALVTAELATAWPKQGGIYVWVREAFGPKLGFLVVWLQWIYNIVWYPAVLTMVAGITAFLFDSEKSGLINNHIYIISFILIAFWIATLVNCFGMKISSWVSTAGSILGTLVPMGFIIALGSWWFGTGQNLEIDLTWEAFWPQSQTINDLVLVTTILFGLMGLEMSAVHAQEVRNPKKDYPKALLISSFIILISLVFSSLAVALVVPKAELNIVTGMVQAFRYFLDNFGLVWLLPLLAILMIIGTMGGVATWIIGPTKGILAAANDGNLPPIMAYTNRHGAPVVILLLQAIIVSILTLVFVLLPIESAYLMLTELTAILALLMYVLMFIAALVLRVKCPEVERPFKIPGGPLGIGIVALIGGGSSLLAMFLGFIPPSQIELGSTLVYQLLLISGVLIFCLPAFFIHKFTN